MASPDDVALGLRVDPKGFNWATVRGTRAAPVFIKAGRYDAPKAQTEADALGSYRREVHDLALAHAVKLAWVREAEFGIAKKALLMKRCRIEGVAVAALDAEGVAITIGSLGSMTARLKPGKPDEKKTAKAYMTADDFRGIDLFAHDDNTREAILAAVSALES